MGSTPRSGRPPGGGNGNLLQYFARKIPWTEEPSRLQSIESQRVTHDRAHTHSTFLNSEYRVWGAHDLQKEIPWRAGNEANYTSQYLLPKRVWSHFFVIVVFCFVFIYLFIYLLLFRLLKLYFHLSLIMFPENSDAFKQINNFISIVSVGTGNNKITLFPGSTCALQKWDKQKMTWTNLEANQWKN